MIHYHGLPVTPAEAAAEVCVAGHVFLSFRHQQQVGLALELASSFALDNGAFSAWRSGAPVTDWTGFYRWVEQLRKHPGFDWAVIPDVIDGDEAANDALIAEWPHGKFIGVPVWHMHESMTRLRRLCEEWPRVALGSSGEYARPNSPAWWDRMSEAMAHICDSDGLPAARLHGLRMLDPRVFTKLPLASADSTNIGQNVGIDQRWKGTYAPMTKPARAKVMRQRIEHFNGAQHWTDPLLT